MRHVLKFTGLLLVLFLVIAASPMLANAEAGELELQSSLEYYQQYMGQKQSVTVYNWGEYISTGADDSLAVNRAFEELTGIKVHYVNFATNEELYSKLRSGNDAYDVIIPSDYMISRMINEDMLLPLVFDKIPNIGNLEEQFQKADYDITGEYSVPYTWGITGIIYNKTMVPESADVETWNILWDQQYTDFILMFYNARDTFAIAQKRAGYSITNSTVKELQNCLADLKEQKPIVQAYVMDEIFDKMIGESAALAPYYAGDAITMMEENENLAFAIPREGVNIFVDAMAIPRSAPNPDVAHLYINFLLEGQVAAANAEFIGYATPNRVAKNYMDPEILANPIAYPSQEVIDNAEYFTSLPEDISKAMDEYWAELLTTDTGHNEILMPVFLIGGVGVSVVINLRRRSKKKRT